MSRSRKSHLSRRNGEPTDPQWGAMLLLQEHERGEDYIEHESVARALVLGGWIEPTSSLGKRPKYRLTVEGIEMLREMHERRRAS